MNIERFLEAIRKFAVPGHPIATAVVVVTTNHTLQGSSGYTADSVAVLRMFSMATWHEVAKVNVDINNFVLGAEYLESAQWWLAKPVMDALSKAT